MLAPAGSGEVLSGAPETASVPGLTSPLPQPFRVGHAPASHASLSLRPLWVYFLYRLSQVAVFTYCLTSAGNNPSVSWAVIALMQPRDAAGTLRGQGTWLSPVHLAAHQHSQPFQQR